MRRQNTRARHLAPTQTGHPGQHRPASTASLPAKAPSSPEGHNGQPQQTAPTPMSQKGPQGSETPGKPPRELEYDGVRGEGPTQTAPTQKGYPDRSPNPPPLTQCQEVVRPDHPRQRKGAGAVLPHLHQPPHTHFSSGKTPSSILTLVAMLVIVLALFRNLATTQPGPPGQHHSHHRTSSTASPPAKAPLSPAGYAGTDHLAPKQAGRPGQHHPHHSTSNTASPPARASFSPVGYAGQPPQTAPKPMSQGGPQCSKTPGKPSCKLKYDEVRGEGPPRPAPPEKEYRDRPASPPPPTECQEMVPPDHLHQRRGTGPAPRTHLHQPLHIHVPRDPGQPPSRNRMCRA